VAFRAAGFKLHKKLARVILWRGRPRRPTADPIYMRLGPASPSADLPISRAGNEWAERAQLENARSAGPHPVFHRCTDGVRAAIAGPCLYRFARVAVPATSR